MTTEQRLRERLHITQQRRAIERSVLKRIAAGEPVAAAEIRRVLANPMLYDMERANA